MIFRLSEKKFIVFMVISYQKRVKKSTVSCEFYKKVIPERRFNYAKHLYFHFVGKKRATPTFACLCLGLFICIKDQTAGGGLMPEPILKKNGEAVHLLRRLYVSFIQ